MDDKKVLSPFQILDWRILTFNCVNSIISVPNDIEHHWKINAHIENVPSDSDDILTAFLGIKFNFWTEHNDQRNTIDGDCVTICQFDLTNYSLNEEPEKLFHKLISRTAMINSLSNLRVFLLQIGLIHQMGPRSLMLPYIDLNQFSFDQDIELID